MIYKYIPVTREVKRYFNKYQLGLMAASAYYTRDYDLQIPRSYLSEEALLEDNSEFVRMERGVFEGKYERLPDIVDAETLQTIKVWRDKP